MSNRFAFFILAVSLTVPSCQYLERSVELETDPRWVALTEEVQERTLEVEALITDNQRIYRELDGATIGAEQAAMVSAQLVKNLDQLAELAELQGRAQVDLDAIAEDYEIPGWQLALAAAGSAIVGMGIPTSGPLAPWLAGAAPLLERFGIRNRRRREDWHKGREK
jgi:hypothetical protein